ncbi:MAG: PmoA family protein, partial [Candidatus Omnitrophica bacterium]|nr:PmoA family protein [Candidatus Omnitrophota bacterium]
EEGTFGKPSSWCDYAGSRDGITEGLAILQSPGNRWFPSRWFTRDYGFFSPTPMYWLENDRLELSKGEALELKYRVIVHSGDVNEAGIAQHFLAYAEKADLK